MFGSIITSHFEKHRQLVHESFTALNSSVERISDALIESLQNGGKILVFGNGGSAAQASHFSGELLGRFNVTRRPLPAIALASDPGTVTCIGNDFGFDVIFERQIAALAKSGDVAVGLSTSGLSENIRRALKKARQNGLITIALTGCEGMKNVEVDYMISIPSDNTALIQELHLIVLHAWCTCIDSAIQANLF